MLEKALSFFRAVREQRVDGTYKASVSFFLCATPNNTHKRLECVLGVLFFVWSFRVHKKRKKKRKKKKRIFNGRIYHTIILLLTALNILRRRRRQRRRQRQKDDRRKDDIIDGVRWSLFGFCFDLHAKTTFSETVVSKSSSKGGRFVD